MSTSTSSSRYTCEICGITFNTINEKEEHIKLEHEEHHPPTGVG
ncbi:MAG: hypothetical protein ACRD8Z_04715 [Nitrososphaeraceae archaeon]